MTAVDRAETPFQGRVTLVTGASRGIGGAVTRRLAPEGADVAVAYGRHVGDAAAVARDVEAAGRRALLLPGDLSHPAVPARLVDETHRRSYTIDGGLLST
jgi:3-oxoacyl-[acyl-carrier protein] reductase